MSAVGAILTFTFVNNVVLGQLLGVCPLLGLPRQRRAALRVSLALAAPLPAAALVFWAVRRLVLVPLGLEGLQLIALCLVLALLVLLPARGWAAYLLPQALANCVVLGVGLATAGYGVVASLVTGLAAGAGYLLAAIVFAGLRERLATEWAPQAMRGLPLSLVTAGLMSLAFLAFDRTLLAALGG
jgi:electron transport complex protein RnfA